jgi:hypothetical protein
MHHMGRWKRAAGIAALVSAALVGITSPASAGRPPPEWSLMLRDARATFTREMGGKILRIVRVGEPEVTGRRTSVDVIPTIYQDVDVHYQAKFGQLEKQSITLHYEWNLGSWGFVGFQWGDMTVTKPGKYPPPPAPPTANELEDAVKEALKEWKVRTDHVESVKATGKPVFAWLDDKPTPSYTFPVKALVEDVVDRTSVYQVQWKTRFVCTLKAQLVLHSDAWELESTDPDCAQRGCSVAKMCQDLWAGGGGKGKRR